MLQGEYREARTIYLEVWKLFKNERPYNRLYLEAILGNARCLEMLGNHSGAAFNYERLFHLDVTSSVYGATEMFDIAKSLAWNYELCGQRARAARYYDIALQAAKRVGDSVEVDLLALRAASCRA